PQADPVLFGGSMSKKLLDDWKLIGAPVDHFAGLKALMPAESLSAAIAKSFAADNATIKDAPCHGSAHSALTVKSYRRRRRRSVAVFDRGVSERGAHSRVPA